MVKICSTCRRCKTLDHFYRSRNRTDGYARQCVECINIGLTARKAVAQLRIEELRKQHPEKPIEAYRMFERNVDTVDQNITPLLLSVFEQIEDL
jgi:hypothetical protein